MPEAFLFLVIFVLLFWHVLDKQKLKRANEKLEKEKQDLKVFNSWWKFFHTFQ